MILTFKQVQDRLKEMKPANRKWYQGVRKVALDIIDPIVEYRPDDVYNAKALLNGADNWRHYAESGNVLPSYYEIEETLCAPYLVKLVSTKDGSDYKESGLKKLEHLRHIACVDAVRLMNRLSHKIKSRKDGTRRL